jgi:hypothetical protein
LHFVDDYKDSPGRRDVTQEKLGASLTCHKPAPYAVYVAKLTGHFGGPLFTSIRSDNI